MNRNTIALLSVILFAGAALALAPQAAWAQDPCRDAAILWWDMGWAPFASPFGYLYGPVDPFSAEWAPWDCGCWRYGRYWEDGYGGWYYPQYDWRSSWRMERTRGAGPTAFRVIPMIPAQRLPGRPDPAEIRHAGIQPRGHTHQRGGVSRAPRSTSVPLSSSAAMPASPMGGSAATGNRKR
jgi:hypothetical protein